MRVLILAAVGSLVLTLAASRLATKPAPPGRPHPGSAETTSAIDWSSTHGDRVLFLGHDLARDWFRHWGATTREPIGVRGLTLALGDLDEPPGGERAVEAYFEGAPKGTVAFFMLGPEAFRGGSAKRAKASVDAALAEVDAIASLARKHGVELVVGGPLPSLPNDTDAHLVDAQARYMTELGKRAGADEIVLFDAYSALSTAGQVTLVRGYARTPAESRLGPAGFEALDEEFFPFMQKRF